MERVYLTQKKYEELMKVLERLKKFDRREISKEIEAARDKGDISENAEYDAAKEKQGHIEKRIAELEDKLSRAAIVESLNIDMTKINIGAKVWLDNLKTKDEAMYHLVGADESDFAKNKISKRQKCSIGRLSSMYQACLFYLQDNRLSGCLPASYP